ncbi:phage tail family protein [Candidatus Saccharibacteria bacterium]|nr:phage tail family protein [Candidatus Saccharibacteria bacterium]
MAVKGVTTKCYILALFIRDDGERFLLGDGKYEFKNNQLHFQSNSIANDVVEVQGNDGYLLAGQVRRSGTQSFDGYVADGTINGTNTEEYRRDFFQFFRKNFFYKVVYVMPDGTAIQRKRGFLVDDPTVKELYQLYPEYHVALNFEDVNYYSYSENNQGEEIYAKEATIYLSAGGTTGGLVWDQYGIVWDSVGAEWESGGAGGPTIVMVDSIDNVYPIWTVTGPANNPQLSVLTTNTTIKYNGNITGTQTLVIDMFNKTALLNGTSVIGNVSGDWANFSPGNNRVIYTTTNADALPSNIKWQEVVG